MSRRRPHEEEDGYGKLKFHWLVRARKGCTFLLICYNVNFTVFIVRAGSNVTFECFDLIFVCMCTCMHWYLYLHGIVLSIMETT
jgi:hypothetical protein